MATAPYGVRLLLGAAVTAIEETRKLPQTILMYPMTVVSQAAHIVMRLQQNVAELAIKGDAALETIFPPKDEQPEWATFDEDIAEQVPDPADTDGERRSDGRFALYTSGAPEPEPAPNKTARPKRTAAAGSKTVETPDVVTELEYETLTLAQLRARLGALTVPELDSLLAYEVATKARAPFQTLLANRITRATAK
jgi:hypothetical protein